MPKPGPWIALALVAVVPAGAEERRAGNRTILYEDVATELGPGLPDAKDLWVTLADLTRATRFELKPEGVCREELCFPIPKANTAEFLRTVSKTTWFNLSAFARLLKQPVARDISLGVYSFGRWPDQQNAHLSSLLAPGFTLPDKDGRTRSLSDFRGKKVLLITWASW
jgi:hypothetical protein